MKYSAVNEEIPKSTLDGVGKKIPFIYGPIPFLLGPKNENV